MHNFHCGLGSHFTLYLKHCYSTDGSHSFQRPNSNYFPTFYTVTHSPLTRLMATWHLSPPPRSQQHTWALIGEINHIQHWIPRPTPTLCPRLACQLHAAGNWAPSLPSGANFPSYPPRLFQFPSVGFSFISYTSGNSVIGVVVICGNSGAVTFGTRPTSIRIQLVPAVGAATHSSILAQRNMAGYSPWGGKELDTTKWLTLFISLFTGHVDLSKFLNLRLFPHREAIMIKFIYVICFYIPNLILKSTTWSQKSS